MKIETVHPSAEDSRLTAIRNLSRNQVAIAANPAGGVELTVTRAPIEECEREFNFSNRRDYVKNVDLKSAVQREIIERNREVIVVATVID